MSTVLNLFQGLLSLFLAYIYFTGGDRLTVMITLFILFLISLVLISWNIRRRGKLAEIFEILIYFLFFGFSFIGTESFRSIISSGPVPNYFWVVWASGLVFNWGEWLGRIVLKVAARPDTDTEE